MICVKLLYMYASNKAIRQMTVNSVWFGLLFSINSEQSVTQQMLSKIYICYLWRFSLILNPDNNHFFTFKCIFYACVRIS